MSKVQKTASSQPCICAPKATGKRDGSGLPVPADDPCSDASSVSDTRGTAADTSPRGQQDAWPTSTGPPLPVHTPHPGTAGKRPQWLPRWGRPLGSTQAPPTASVLSSLWPRTTQAPLCSTGKHPRPSSSGSPGGNAPQGMQALVRTASLFRHTVLTSRPGGQCSGRP